MKEIYKKPTITSDGSGRGVFPAVAAALSFGVMMGLSRGKAEIDSTHTQKLQRCIK